MCSGAAEVLSMSSNVTREWIEWKQHKQQIAPLFTQVISSSCKARLMLSKSFQRITSYFHLCVVFFWYVSSSVWSSVSCKSKDVFIPARHTDIPFLLYFQFCYLPGYYQALLITGMILLTVIEVVRLYLGYIGNLKERVIQTNILSEAERRSLWWTLVSWITQQEEVAA